MSYLSAEVSSVQCHEAPLVIRDLVFWQDRLDWARLDARVTVDALFWIDEELLALGEAWLLGGGVDAVHRTNLDA